MRTFLVIGLGRFGSNLAIKLSQLGNEVLVVDRDEVAIERVAPQVTRAQIGDCMDETVLHALGVGNFDICFVCISDSFQASLEVTSLLKDMGAKWVVAKASRESQAKFLEKIGADEVICPERDMAQRAAVKYSVKNAFEYIELTPEYAIFEIQVSNCWVGKSLRELNIRGRHNVNVIGTKQGKVVIPITDPDHVFQEQEHLIVAGSKVDVLRLMDAKRRN